MEFNLFVFPAPDPSYTREEEDLVLIPFYRNAQRSGLECEKPLTPKLSIKVSVISSQPTHAINQPTVHHEIPCLLLNKARMTDGLIVYFHANAEDIGMTKELGKTLSAQLGVAFLAVEYPGYGIYAGSCSSDKMLQDAHAVMKHVLCKCYEENIIVMGRSIGSGVAIDVAAKYHKLRCLSLISPFTSLQAVVKEYAGSFLCRIVQERFRNLEKMSRVQCPTLFIHGDQDNLVPIDHSESLLKEAGGIAYLERIAGMDHNTFIFRLHIALPMLTFLGKIQPVQEQY